MATGRQYLVALCETFGSDTYTLHKAMKRVNQEQTDRLHRDTIDEHFEQHREPRERVLAIIRAAGRDLGWPWRDELHSFEAFRCGRFPTREIRLEGPWLNLTGAYAGDYIVLRELLDHTIVADYLRLTVTKSEGVLDALWMIQERDGPADRFVAARGSARIVKSKIDVRAGYISQEKETHTASLAVSRNANDDPSLMVAVCEGCCSHAGAVVGKVAILIRLSQALPPGESWETTCREAQSTLTNFGCGALQFDSVHATPLHISNVPRHLVNVLRRPVPVDHA